MQEECDQIYRHKKSAGVKEVIIYKLSTFKI